MTGGHDVAHWHIGTYTVVLEPAAVTAEFWSTRGSLGAAKVTVKRWIKDRLLPDPAAMAMVALPSSEIMSALGQWMAMPDNGYIHLWPYCYDVFGCDGRCRQAAYDNAVEMTKYFTQAKMVTASVTGDPSDLSLMVARADHSRNPFPISMMINDAEEWIRQGQPER